MKKLLVLLLVLAITTIAQFKQKPGAEQPKVSDSFIQPATSSEWFSFFNPDNFQMHHSYSASYTTTGKQGIALQQYTNTMLYQFTPDLRARVDVSFMNSPFSTLDYRTQGKFNSLYLNRAEISYRPWQNTQIRLSYRQYPISYFGYGNYPTFGGMFSTMDDYEGQ